MIQQLCKIYVASVALFTFRSLLRHETSGVGNPRVTSHSNVTDFPVSVMIIPLSGTGLTSGLTEMRNTITINNMQTSVFIVVLANLQNI